MEFIVFWIFLSILVGAFASSKRRSGFAWFFLSLIISPLVTFIILLVSGAPQGALKKCPKCAEEVKIEALICRFCNFEFPIFSGPPKPEKITQKDVDELWELRKRVRDKYYHKS